MELKDIEKIIKKSREKSKEFWKDKPEKSKAEKKAIEKFGTEKVEILKKMVSKSPELLTQNS